MKYISTRASSKTFGASEVIVKGISDDGGLFVPSSFPNLDGKLMDELSDMNYPERVAKILSLYMDDFSFEELLIYANNAYSRFDGEPCPIVKVEDGLYMLELWHGSTCAYQDMPLALLPYLIVAAKKKLGRKDKALVLTAADGDTGKAALEGFKDVDGTKIIAFYPTGGISEVQRLQLVTAEGKNVHVAGIKGAFDDAQNAVKCILNDENIGQQLGDMGYVILPETSINWGIIAPQIAYYISAYLDLVDGGEIEQDDKVNFVVPTGDFGNTLAGYYAYKMGLPVNKFIIAANANNALTDFFNDGVFDINRDFYRTMSPSMDVPVPANLERFVFEVSGRDDAYVRELYAELSECGRFEMEAETVRDSVFEVGWADEEDTKNAIFTFFDLDDYVMDTHTAVGASVYNDYSCETDDDTPTVILSIANPYKYATDVLAALGGREKDPFKALNKLQVATAMECPENISELQEAEEIHTEVIDSSKAANTVLKFVKG